MIRHNFDFKVATREFIKFINKDDPDRFFEMDVKTVRLRWTDIEIRKYRLNDPGAGYIENWEEYDDRREPPPLEQGPPPTEEITKTEKEEALNPKNDVVTYFAD